MLFLSSVVFLLVSCFLQPYERFVSYQKQEIMTILTDKFSFQEVSIWILSIARPKRIVVFETALPLDASVEQKYLVYPQNLFVKFIKIQRKSSYEKKYCFCSNDTQLQSQMCFAIKRWKVFVSLSLEKLKTTI